MTGASANSERDSSRRNGRWSLGAIVGTLTGLAPHLLHHAGLLAGTALLSGIGGTVVFGALGLAAMLPMLLRLRRRFGSWWAPAIAGAAFAAMFAVSSLLIGPALRAGVDEPAVPANSEHSRHHG